MFNPVKMLRDLLSIKRKYYILNVVAAKGYGARLDYETFIDDSLGHKTDEEIIDDIVEMIERQRKITASLES